jgi:hypothetical protein
MQSSPEGSTEATVESKRAHEIPKYPRCRVDGMLSSLKLRVQMRAAQKPTVRCACSRAIALLIRLEPEKHVAVNTHHPSHWTRIQLLVPPKKAEQGTFLHHPRTESILRLMQVVVS